MQKLISYSFLLLFVWQIVGFVSYFEFSYYHLKRELKSLIKNGIPKDELVIFEFSKDELNELVWLKKNEFNKDGSLFDVVRSHVKKGGITYMECISDSKEKILFAHLDQNVSRNLGDDGNSNPISNWMKLLHFPIVTSNQSVDYELSDLQFEENNYYFFLALFATRTLKIDSPPPQISC